MLICIKSKQMQKWYSFFIVCFVCVFFFFIKLFEELLDCDCSQ